MLTEKIAERCPAVSTNPEDYKYKYYVAVEAYTDDESKGKQEILQVIYSNNEYDDYTLDSIVKGLWAYKSEYRFVSWLVMSESFIKDDTVAGIISKIDTDDFPSDIILCKVYDDDIPDDDYTDYRDDDESYEKSDDNDYPYTYTAIVDVQDANTEKITQRLVYVKTDRKLKLPDADACFMDEETVEGIVEELAAGPGEVVTDVIVISDDNRDEYKDEIKNLIEAGRAGTVSSRLVKPFDDEETSSTDE